MPADQGDQGDQGGRQVLPGHVDAYEAQRILGYAHRSTIDHKCAAYRKRIAAIRAEGREPTAEELASRRPGEIRCIHIGSGNRRQYLIPREELDDFPVNRAGAIGRGPGRPAGSPNRPKGRGSKGRKKGARKKPTGAE